MTTSTQFQPVISYDVTATIAAGQTTSGVIDLTGNTLCGLFLPATFDGTTLSFLAAPSASGTFVPVYSGGAAYTLSGAASSFVPVEAMAVIAGARFLKIVAATMQTTTDTVITLAVRPI